jgi:hypothetical protein
LILALVVFLAVSLVAEIILWLLAKVVIDKLVVRLAFSVLGKTLIIFIGLLLIYLLVGYFTIRWEKTLTVRLLNDLRRRWFKNILRQPEQNITDDDRENLIAKLSYHLSLLQLGFTSAGVGLVNWLLLSLALVILGWLIGPKVLLLIGGVIILGVFLMIIGYLVAKKYVSREQTLYTKIIKHLLNSVYNLSLLQDQSRETWALKKLDKLVSLDSWFRVRRDLWMKFGNNILFAVILLAGVGFYVSQLYWPFWAQWSVDSLFFYGLVAVFLLRFLYLSLRIGLFLVPLRLGLILSIPRRQPRSPRHKTSFRSLCLQATKARFWPGDTYQKKIKFCFKSGERVLLVDDFRPRLDSLAGLLVGLGGNNTKPWIFKVDGRRYLYQDWFKLYANNYFVSPLRRASGTLAEFLLGKAAENITADELEKIFRQLRVSEVWSFIFSSNKQLTKKITDYYPGLLERGLLQLAYCYLNHPGVIIIDSYWVDLNDQRFNQALRLLAEKLNKSVIILLSTRENNILSYDQKITLVSEK